jgi:hypothetical protein
MMPRFRAYQAVIDKFPNDPIAADAQYQIGYIWYEAARLGTNDQAATQNARTAFEDFLFRYPKSEKAPQARENLERLQQKSTGDAMKIAKFYDKEKAYRAAVIYYGPSNSGAPGNDGERRSSKTHRSNSREGGSNGFDARRCGERTEEKASGFTSSLLAIPDRPSAMATPKLLRSHRRNQIRTCRRRPRFCHRRRRRPSRPQARSHRLLRQAAATPEPSASPDSAASPAP